jgi:serine/threonine protein kinase
MNTLEIPRELRSLTAIGDKTAQAVYDLCHGKQQARLFPNQTLPSLNDLASALVAAAWTDDNSAAIVDYIARETEQQQTVDLASLAIWVRAHKDDLESVMECVRCEPPQEVRVLRVLSRAGSQKIVFLGTWQLTQQEIVLKKILGLAADKVLSREMQSNPLTLQHENIIETHILSNTQGERFLVERRLSSVLSDKWRAAGIHEAANLLTNIANALAIVHDLGLVHGDVKPDNIGVRDDSFVLLDFGICRPAALLAAETTPTGSLRTRAPELLQNGNYQEPQAVDIWALGATVFNTLLGRFPLIEEGERVPRISSPQERAAFEDMLRRRVEEEWDRRVQLENLEQPLREILGRMLQRDPRSRPSAKEVREWATKHLSAFLKTSLVPGRSKGYLSPIDELLQVREYFSSTADLSLLPPNRTIALLSRLKELHGIHGFSESDRNEIARLTAILDSRSTTSTET